MVRYGILVLLFIDHVIAFSQVVGGVQSKGMDMNVQPYGTIKEIRNSEREVVGNTYLNENWLIGTIELFNGSKLIDNKMRYEIASCAIEIKINGEIKSIDCNSVKAFELNSSKLEHYENASQFRLNGTNLFGFLALLQKGKYSLCSKIEVNLVQGHYVKALDLGNDQDEYYRTKKYYLAIDSNLIEIVSNKRKFVRKIPEFGEIVLKYLKENRLSLKNENDLLKVTYFMNQEFR